MIRRPPRSTHCISSAASDVYKRQVSTQSTWGKRKKNTKTQMESKTQQFEKAAEAIKKWFQDKNDTSDNNKKTLYKFYKQATVGDCNTAKPGFLQFKESAKWEAWNELKGKMTKEQAQEEYIKFAKTILPADRQVGF
eukprot:TRINITY_DN12980_c0_g1_i5.p3 TRINITY_DN12980_c0_g1~~TRINITY_DN12980_c0_g1_i5.p3  ORF type:complete len:137 (-),score=55.08 TRINITY_DN12980_c0_g1_i5:327-737(-)